VALSAEELSLRGKAGAHTMLSRNDAKAITENARAASPGSDRYWEAQVDPSGELDPAERARRANHAKKAYFAKLALKSARVRRARKGGGRDDRAE
jgi:hypothetical protein